jgi:hypothetical protein
MTLAGRLALESALQLYGLVFRKLRGAFQVLTRLARLERHVERFQEESMNRILYGARKTACALSSFLSVLLSLDRRSTCTRHATRADFRQVSERRGERNAAINLSPLACGESFSLNQTAVIEALAGH